MIKAINNRLSRFRKSKVQEFKGTQEDMLEFVRECVSHTGIELEFNLLDGPEAPIATYQYDRRKIVWHAELDKINEQVNLIRGSAENFILSIVAHEYGHAITPDLLSKVEKLPIFYIGEEHIKLEEEAWILGASLIRKIKPEIMKDYNRFNQLNILTYKKVALI